MATTYTNRSSSVDSSTGHVLAWFGVALQAVAFVAVWWRQRWNGLWTVGGFFVLLFEFMPLQDRIASMITFFIVCTALLNAGGLVLVIGFINSRGSPSSSTRSPRLSSYTRSCPTRGSVLG